MSRTVATRIEYIDIARIFGIFLVYYGHFIESLMKAGVATAAVQYKFIYSFHMPLFFVLAGYVSCKINPDTEFGSYFRYRMCTRLIPFVFFTFLLIVPTLFLPGNHGPLAPSRTRDATK